MENKVITQEYDKDNLDYAVRVLISEAQKKNFDINKCTITIPKEAVLKHGKYDGKTLYGIKYKLGDKLEISEL